jgi:hypothetical protein
MDDRFVPWPFPILKPEAAWNDFDRDLLDFMQTAYAEGYRPRHERQGNAIAASAPTGRSVFLVFRGSRNGWEPWLCEGDQSNRLGPRYGFEDSRCVCVRPPFRGVAHLALEWLRSHPLEELLPDFEFVGGRPEGIVLRPEAVRPSFILKSEQLRPESQKSEEQQP